MVTDNNTTAEQLIQEDIAGKPDVFMFIGYIALLLTLVAAGIASNIFLIVSLLKQKHRSPFNLTVVNLAFVDILVFLIVIPLCLVNIIWPDMSDVPCRIISVAGLLLSTYSIHTQCLILFCSVRIITSSLPNNYRSCGWIKICVASGTFLAMDTFVTVFPNLMYGKLHRVPAVGYCFYVLEDLFLPRQVLTVFYLANYTGSILFCIALYVILMRFVRKNSARPNLARQRHLSIFKLMLRNFFIWAVCFSLASLCRTVGVSNHWPGITFQLGYFLLWFNSFLNPICHILTSSCIKTCFPRLTAKVGASTNQKQTRVHVISHN